MNKVYRSWLISYGAIMIFSLFASLLIYSFANKALSNEIEKVETAVLENTRILLDSRLAEIMLTASILRQDDKLKRFVHDTYPFYKPDLSMDMGSGKALLLQASDSSLTISEIYLYSLRSKVTLSSRYGLNDNSGFNLPAEDAFGLDQRQFDEMVGRVTSQPTYEIITPRNGNGIQQVLLLYPVFNKSIHVEGVLIFKLEPDFLMQMKNIESSEFNLLILGKDNQLISANMNATYLSKLKSVRQLEGSEVIEIDDIQYLVSTARSYLFGWKYIAISSLDVFQSSMRSVRDRTILFFLSFLVLGSIISILLVRRNYTPIRNLMSHVSKITGSKTEKIDNEFQLIDRVIQDVFIEKEKYSKLLRNQRIHMQTIVLTRLLKGRILTLESAKDMLQNEDICFPYGHFIVAVMVIEDFGILFDTEEDDPLMNGVIELSQDIVKNILEELFSVKMSAKVFEADNTLVCLINLDKGEQDIDQVIEILNHGLATIRQHFKMVLTTGVSTINENFIGITLCYQEATETLEMTRMLGSPGDIALYDRKYMNTSKLAQHVMHLETRRLFLNHLMVENFEAAREIAESFLKVLERSDAPNAYRHITNSGMIDDLSASLEYLCGDHASLRHPAGNALLSDLLSSESLIDSRRLILSLFNELISIREEKDTIFQHDQKLTQIAEYISANLADYNLSVTGLAKAVNLSVSKVARIIHSKLGMSTLDYIQKARIELAKQMLIETNLNINEISRRVGYENFRTLNTIFKKVEGITGAQYRENYLKNH